MVANPIINGLEMASTVKRVTVTVVSRIAVEPVSMNHIDTMRSMPDEVEVVNRHDVSVLPVSVSTTGLPLEIRRIDAHLDRKGIV